ncbi:hypothetical protein PVAG01_03505 [Phlyctema vagabunda]|uniref:Uncharacterized protein n=1 Tax=Phlyctema vagabunda TaxID=108571 RepID=A0ABR4PLL2_9HELO
MDVRLFRKPVADVFSGRSQCLFTLNTTARRHESSYRRTRQKLNIKPNSSFLADPSAQQDHIIFNPPAAAPSVLHTPTKFLPKEDQRRHILESTAARRTPASLPPVINKFAAKEEKHHLTKQDVNEIRRLRVADPKKWSIVTLAKRYNCSQTFVQIISAELTYTEPTLKQHSIEEREKREAYMARWGNKRAKAREDRTKRKEMALRDE